MYNIVVIGGGPAGVTAALRASELGASVALVERARLGGTCTNDGCVPTRMLAKAARLIRDADQFEEYGLTGHPPLVDFPSLLAKTQNVVYKIHEKKQLIKHLDESGIAVFSEVGDAHFTDEHTIALKDGRKIQGEKFILAVGGQARKLDFPGGEHALTHSDIWSLKKQPESLIIVGASATGCQLASIFSTFGTRVWLVEVSDRILRTEDEAISKAMTSAFERRGIHIITGINGINRIEKRRQSLELSFSHGGEERSLSAEAILLAVGWPGNAGSLNLEAAKVRSERNYIPVDDYLRTSSPHIFAAGDITGRMMLVQSAGYDARIAAENAVLGLGQRYQHKIVPHGGFTDPEYSGVGLTEAQARTRQNGEDDCLVAVVPYADLDRAVIDGRTEGFCKLIVSQETHRILGAHVMGEQAVEIVQIVAAGMAADMWVEQLAELELAYPTYTAIVGLAARQLVRQLGVMPLAHTWQTLGKPHASEWERHEVEL
jgi:pyruvate/2-oxoglutarate dehydrogenase complex dihydrolipoamide dehydrogenase (E3) component